MLYTREEKVYFLCIPQLKENMQKLIGFEWKTGTERENGRKRKIHPDDTFALHCINHIAK